jgi:putative heme-binding domain-containing protein
MANKSAARNLYLGLALCAGIVSFRLLPFASAQHAPAARRDLPARVEAGGRVFRASCSMSYCHGASGSGGGAPKLRGREFSAEHLTAVTTDGIPGSAMPAFKRGLSKEQIADVVVYVLSLSPENAGQLEKQRAATDDAHLNPGPSSGADRPAKTESPATATPSGDASRGDASVGRELFFAATELRNCRVCHTFRDKGGKVGPDLTAVAGRPPEEILRSIVTPDDAVEERYATFRITLRDGRRFTGVKRDEVNEAIRLYDTSALPPVSRAFLRSEVAKIEKLSESSMPHDYGKRFTPRQLDDLVAFLKSSGGN